MKDKKLNLVGRVILAIAALAGVVKGSQGALEISYDMNNLSYDNYDCKSAHMSGASEEPNDIWDVGYNPRSFSPNGKGAKIISKFNPNCDPNELKRDVKPEDSNTPVNLELSIHTQSGSSVNFSNHESELKFSFYMGAGWKFGNEPITYWEKDPCDANYASLVANVRKEILQNDGVVPLPILNGTYDSEEVHLRSGVRYDVYDTDLHEDEDNITNFRDYAVFADNWKRQGITDSNRSNVDDPGAWADFNLDGDVDYTDLDFMNDVWVYDITKTKW